MIRISLVTLMRLTLLLGLTGSKLQAQSLPGSGNCLTFNGTSTFITCGTSDRGITQRVTLEAWIKTSSYNNQWVIGKYSDQFGEEKGYCLATWYGQAIVAGRALTGNYLTSGFSTTRVDDNRWHHLAGVIDNNVWRIYVDGILESSVTHSYTNGNLTNSEPLLIGDYHSHRSRPFTGEIDEVKIWRTALTETQIRETMCHKMTTAPPDLVAYYRLDTATGITTTDAGRQPVSGLLAGFSSSPWHFSGAALGDRSVYAYSSGAGSPASTVLQTLAGDTVSGVNFSASARGAHLYVVDAPPQVPVPGGTGRAYFGLYTLSPTATYVAELRPPACRALFRRTDNSGLVWSAAPITPRPGAIGTNDAYRGEYAWSNSAAPPVPFSLGSDTTICGGILLRLIAPAQPLGTRYQWSDGSSGRELLIRQAGTYSLTVLHPCDTLTASIRVAATVDSLFVPNVFTPDGDGRNDTFMLTGLCTIGTWALDVYSRWGRRVFSATNYANDWTAPTLPGGTYYYHLRQPSTNKTIKGWVEIVR